MLIISNTIYTPALFALTSGPTQPEVQSFEPIATNQMVDLFSGDFTYNIPLFELPGPNGGYPFNLAYHSGIGMDQEASWVGLGWSLNPGAIMRNVRGIPDDFDGDLITQELRMKDNNTYGIDFGGNAEIFGSDEAGIGLNLKIYYNNYKGVGYGLGFSATVLSNENNTSGLGLSGDVDSQGGAGINAQLSLNASEKDNNLNFSAGIGLNSGSGLQLSLSGSISKKKDNKDDHRNSLGGGSSISFAGNSYVPGIEHEMEGVNLSGNFKTGASLFGVFGNFNIGIFYNTERVKNNTENTPSYGYMYLHEPFKGGVSSKNSLGEKYILDFNREKDGLISKSTPNLAIPNLTYDYFNIDGQGLSGMFRPYRSDIGHVHDPFMESKSYGGSLGFELPVNHFGASATYTSSTNSTSDWENNSFLYTFKENASGESNYEPVYFKMHGDMASMNSDELKFIGNEDAVYMPVEKPTESSTSILKNNNNPKLKRNDRTDIDNSVLSNYRGKGDRMPRETSIQYLTNEEIGAYSNNPFGEYNIKTKVYDIEKSIYTTKELDRSSRVTSKCTCLISKHIGAITALNSEGIRYVYALPAYNLEQREHIFSVTSGQACNVECQMPIKTENNVDRIDYESATPDKYYKKTETPPYAHSYLLTSLLGADYVDLTNDGPSEDDLGYWVKFNYSKMEDYGWRAPYKDANYDPGMLSFKSDDKGSFVFGKKEMYYLESVETKTHIAKFTISKRDDGKGTKEFNRTNSFANKDNAANNIFLGNSYGLDEIILYSKDLNNPVSNLSLIKTIHFDYGNDLCPKVENNINYSINGTSNAGKFTLKKLWFTYNNNTTGALNPYEFTYNQAWNFPYAQNKYDRWGNYKSTSSGTCDRVYAPYVDQSEYAARDNDASAWQLSSIRLPSGGNININYESDDYAYVQHRVANQMFKIAKLGISDSPSKIYDNDWDPRGAADNISQRRIYFNLERPISKSILDPDKEFKKQYLENLVRREGNSKYYQLYFKIKSVIRGTIAEYISGYADIDINTGNYGVDANSDNGTAYTRGFVTVKSFQTDRNKQKFYHPFAAAAWQFIRTNKPEIITAEGTFTERPGTDDMDKALRAKSLLNIANSIRDLFIDFNSVAFTSHWGNKINLNESYIRLCSPDKRKYGGGSRVKSVLIDDNWNAQTNNSENSATYGQTYDYTINEDGQTISSGVATYEPMIGGDENPLRYAKKYSNNILFKSPNQLYFEYPINESLYPGPSIGYRKVTVRSLAANEVVNDELGNERSTGGVSVNEFYTCKEYPVITEETDIDKKTFDLNILIPLIGVIETHNVSAGQGYVIKLNDMHGKPKSVKNYALDTKGNISQLVSGEEYFYKRKEKVLDGVLVYETDNEVDVMLSFSPDKNSTNSKIEKKKLGTEYDFVTDMRFNKFNSFMGGVNINVDFLISLIPIPIPVPWPAINTSKKELKTAVTNKVVFKPGVLEKVVLTDGASIVSTENLLFDEATGKPLLTKVTNEYKESLYNLTLPAYKDFDGMGQAYLNDGISFEANATTGFSPKTYILTPYPTNSDVINYLNPGDVLKSDNNKITVLNVNKDDGTANVYCDQIITGTINLKILRSGKRNLLKANTGVINSLNINPVENIQPKSCSFSINVPEVEYEYQLMLGCCNIFKSTGIFDLNNPVYDEYNSIRSKCDFINNDNISSGNIAAHYIIFSKNTVLINRISFHKNWDPNVVDKLGWITDVYVNSGNVYCDLIAKDNKIMRNVRVQFDFPINLEPNSVKYYDKTCNSEYLELASVLNSSFTSYSDNWTFNTISNNPYQTGQKGNWLPKYSFAYVGARQQSTEPNLKTDGIINNFPIVNLQNPFFTNCKPEWKITEEITKVNEHSKGIESKDILGRFSSVHFGYSGGETTLTASNSRANEVGYQGFEDIITNSYTSSTNYSFNSDNLSFTRTLEPKNVYNQYEVIVGNGQAAVIDKPYISSETNKQIIVQAFLQPTTDRNAEQVVFSSSYNSNFDASSNITYSNKSVLSINDAESKIFAKDRLWKGNIIIVENAETNSSTSQVINNIAHTGKKSLLSDGSVNLQRSINLIPGKNYILDFWTKSNSFSSSVIKVYNASNENIIDIPVEDLVGLPVNGWQKVQKTFSLPSGGKYIGLVFPANTYIDDIRISPFQSLMKTYIYDVKNLKLTAILDENNYAALYFYDEQGNLFLVKKETENGIQTIQESRSHMPEKL